VPQASLQLSYSPSPGNFESNLIVLVTYVHDSTYTSTQSLGLTVGCSVSYVHSYITVVMHIPVSNSIGQSPSWEAIRYLASQNIPCYFMVSRSSLQHSQKPATCPIPEPHQSNPCPHPLIHAHAFPCVSHQNPVCTLPLPHACYMPHPSHSS